MKQRPRSRSGARKSVIHATLSRANMDYVQLYAEQQGISAQWALEEALVAFLATPEVQQYYAAAQDVPVTLKVTKDLYDRTVRYCEANNVNLRDVINIAVVRLLPSLIV